jgi:hypothetical protein
MARLYGRAARGERCRGRATRRLENDDLDRRLRIGGPPAPMILDGPMDGAAFRASCHAGARS